jgi:hypothetical protein
VGAREEERESEAGRGGEASPRSLDLQGRFKSSELIRGGARKDCGWGWGGGNPEESFAVNNLT